MKVSFPGGLLLASTVSFAIAAHAADDQALLKRMTDGANALRMIAPNPKTFELVNVQYDSKKDVVCIKSRDGGAAGKGGASEKVAYNSAGTSIPWPAYCEKNSGADWTARVKAQL